MRTACANALATLDEGHTPMCPLVSPSVDFARSQSEISASCAPNRAETRQVSRGPGASSALNPRRFTASRRAKTRVLHDE
jgi:hypothetical protein